MSCDDRSRAVPPESADAGHSAGVRLTEGVTGQITGDDASAVAGASVLAASADPNGPAVPEMAIVSDASGRYEWPLRPGRYELAVIAEGYRRASKIVSVRSGEVATLDFVLAPE